MEPKKHPYKYHIPHDLIIYDFDNHLALLDNRRIFFSGKFGTGKSYFLEEFFRERKQFFEVVQVYPIKYSTASNTDVFELIKFDILYHLIRHHEEAINNNISLSVFMQFQWFIKGKLNKIDPDFSIDLLTSLTDNEEIKNNLGFNPVIIKTFFNIYQKVNKNFIDYQTKHKEGDIEKIDSFLETILKKMPEYGDADPLTCIIKEIIISIQKSLNKKIVLLIDDMDRLDPDHLFRILNIFGNHLESSSKNQNYINENRFGFDKVIFVGDIANIKSIFHHKYGINTDFDGYFTKYYSKRIYHFSVSDIILDNFHLFIEDLKIPSVLGSDIEDIFLAKYLIFPIVEKLVESNSLTFRTISQKRGYDFFNKSKLVNTRSNQENGTMIQQIYNFFIRLYGDKSLLISEINRIEDFDIYSLSTEFSKFKEFFSELIINTRTIIDKGKVENYKEFLTQGEIGYRIKLKSLYGEEYY